MNTFRRIFSYAKPAAKYWPPYLFFSILSVLFGSLTNASISAFSRIKKVESLFFELFFGIYCYYHLVFLKFYLIYSLTAVFFQLHIFLLKIILIFSQ